MSRRLLQTSALQVAGEVGCPEKCFGGFGFYRVQGSGPGVSGSGFKVYAIACSVICYVVFEYGPIVS